MALESFKVETRKFCCCLPARLGVFVLSLLSIMAGGFMGVIGWMQVAQLKEHPMETSDEVALFMHASIFSLLGFLAIFGFAGSLLKHRRMVVAFSVGLAIHLGLSVISGIFTLYAVFRQSPAAAIERCINGATDAETKEVCQTGSVIVKGLLVAIYIVSWMFELYGYFVTERYAEQLEEEEVARMVPILPQHINHLNDPHGQYGAYAPYPSKRFTYASYYDSHRSYDARYPSGAPQDQRDQRENTRERPSSGYAYTLPDNAYGVQRGKDAAPTKEMA